jgi:hypothetical protein
MASATSGQTGLATTASSRLHSAGARQRPPPVILNGRRLRLTGTDGLLPS